MKENDNIERSEIVDDDLLEDISYELDVYISESSDPRMTYREEVVPFFVSAINHSFDNTMTTFEKTLLAEIESAWFSADAINKVSLNNIRKEVKRYDESLPIENINHRYLAECLKFLTSEFYPEDENEHSISLIWSIISGLLGAGISPEWLYGRLVESFSEHISDQYKNK